MYLFLKDFILILKHPSKIMFALFILLTSLFLHKNCKEHCQNHCIQKATMSNLEKPKLITFDYMKKDSGLKYRVFFNIFIGV